ncbi:tetratricopeptide repeat protein [Cellulosilyticum sp. ST5]|uniref:tetratricopeptide repeat protein n=1 Tax=unclassified Cellulosilyticum TaxID=2643091 RepID=UPI000F8C5FFA|nr:tetratricopeptide repeat protein [Cellulosilyticum sp. WCF-2]QEH68672.1 tetratricopeptide repeat protein [Cellulosilyticum sp. WCF-2]
MGNKMMEYVCPYCGNKAKHDVYCHTCHRKIDWVKEIWERSIAYYNRGYYAAEEKNLTLAIDYLQKALHLNKYNTEARNLLGLIYFEVGRVGEALKEWIISHSLNKEDEVSTHYINEIQKSPKQLVSYKEVIHLYNKALEYLKQKNTDVAIIRLKKAVGVNPNFVEAKVLLGLCYMQDKQFYKANEQIKGALKIDSGHQKALRYFKALSGEDTSTVQPYELEYIPTNQSHKKVKPVRVIDRSISLRYSVLYFIIGLIAMFVIYHFLIHPNQVKSYEQEITRLTNKQDELSDELNQIIKDTNLKAATLEADNTKLKTQTQEYEKQLGAYVQKDKLVTAKTHIEERMYVEAAEALYNIAPSLLDEESKMTYEALKEACYEKAAAELYNEGYQLLNGEDYAGAKGKLEAALIYDGTSQTARRSLYYLGETEEKLGNITEAQNYYNKVITEFPDTYEARRAKERIQ